MVKLNFCKPETFFNTFQFLNLSCKISHYLKSRIKKKIVFSVSFSAFLIALPDKPPVLTQSLLVILHQLQSFLFLAVWLNQLNRKSISWISNAFFLIVILIYWLYLWQLPKLLLQLKQPARTDAIWRPTLKRKYAGSWQGKQTFSNGWRYHSAAEALPCNVCCTFITTTFYCMFGKLFFFSIFYGFHVDFFAKSF